jgi:outer membrane lipopolysaccharide assembly protein LptE/RlpB
VISTWQRLNLAFIERDKLREENTELKAAAKEYARHRAAVNKVNAARELDYSLLKNAAQAVVDEFAMYIHYVHQLKDGKQWTNSPSILEIDMSYSLDAMDVMDVNSEQRKLIDELRSKVCDHNWQLMHPLDNIEQCSLCNLYRDRVAEYPSETQTKRIIELEAENTALEERIETNYQEYQDMDAYYEKAIKEFESQLQIIRTLAQAAVDAKYVDEGELDALAKALGD